MPPVSGSAAASSANESAPQRTINPPSTQTANIQAGSGTRAAIDAGVRKIPLPIVMPMTMPTEVQKPRRRSSVGIGEQANLKTRLEVKPEHELQLPHETCLRVRSAEVRVAKRVGGLKRAHVRTIQQIDDLELELARLRATEPDVLDERRVDVGLPRPTDVSNRSRRIAERSSRREAERQRVDPCCRRMIGRRKAFLQAAWRREFLTCEIRPVRIRS